MGLIHTPGPAFQWCADNLLGTLSGSAPGTNFTFGASNADGASVAVLSSLAHEAQYLVVGVTGCATSTEDNSALVDVLWDPAGGTAWTNFIDNLLAGYAPACAGGTVGITTWYHFPIRIPATTSLGIRARKTGSTAATTGQVVMYVYGQPKRPDMWWCGQRVESLGISESTSKGTAITPGASGSFTWASIGTSTRRYGAIQLGFQPSTTALTAKGYYWQLGLGSARIPGTPTMYASGDTGENYARSGGNNSPILCDIASGAALQAGATCATTVPVAHTAAIYGVY